MNLFVRKMANWRSAQVIRLSALTAGMIFLGLFFCVRHPLLFVAFVFCYGVILPSLPLVGHWSFSRRRRPKEADRSGKGSRIFALIFVLLLGLGVVGTGLAPYVYTPPALTRENIAVYHRCVDFALSHPELEPFGLSWSGRLVTDNGSWLVREDVDREALRPHLSDHDIRELCEIAASMRRVRCIRCEKRRGIVLFYRYRNVFLPNPPGVVYSLHGENPNQISPEDIQELSPFIHLSNNWYFSRRLVVGGLRRYYTIRVPHSLFDHAARVQSGNTMLN